MSIRALGKLAAGLILGGMLSGCVDANLDVALTSDSTASATLTQVMRQDAYTTISLIDGLESAQQEAAIKAAADATKAIAEAEAAGKDASDIIVPPIPVAKAALASRFCSNGRMLQRVDGGATCMDSSEGEFAELALGDLQQQMSFEAQADGMVRIALPTQQLRRAASAAAALDPESQTIIAALFHNRKIVIRFSGAEVGETNMTLAKDAQSASKEIAILDLINGTAELPEELYAVVRAP